MTLREFRRSKLLTQDEFADRIGVSRVSIARCEAAGTAPTFTIMQAVARSFEIKLSHVVGMFYEDMQK